MFSQTLQVLQDLPSCIHAQYRVIQTCPLVKQTLFNVVSGKGRPLAQFNISLTQLLVGLAMLVTAALSAVAVHLRSHMAQRAEVALLRQRNQTLGVRNEFLEEENRNLEAEVAALNERLEQGKGTAPKTGRRRKNLIDTASLFSS